MAPVTGNIFAYSLFYNRSRDGISFFGHFRKEEIPAINEAFIQTNTKKVMNFDLSVITGRLKIIVTLNLQQNCKNALDKIRKMFVNNICKQSTY